MATFAERFTLLRKESRLTQEEIAKRLGVSKGTIGNYESGAREPKDFETLEMIADFFNCDIDFLIGRKNTRPEYTLEEMTIIELYRKADDYDKATVKQVLSRYKEDTASAVG